MLPRDHYLKQPFHDQTHFPKGFDHDDQLSSTQARLLRKYGTLIQALCRKEVTNPTDEDQHLLKVIDHQYAPRSPIEQAWIKYLRLVAERAEKIQETA
ncbi:DUF413 domain-containing protein [Marinimicrobium alkaliphilum]|uniref:DUF413 domain-containing protein n=1 Tax=Marinimicrobium alkaliphilum TaxID=2202654 RepID=UPI000DBAD23B|nr:DUF413 domain-containing protein [Marinimicrobium alkaliphilum]